MCEKTAVNAIKIARIVLMDQKKDLEKMVADGKMFAMAALLFLETTERDSIVAVNLP